MDGCAGMHVPYDPPRRSVDYTMCLLWRWRRERKLGVVSCLCCTYGCTTCVELCVSCGARGVDANLMRVFFDAVPVKLAVAIPPATRIYLSSNRVYVVYVFRY